MMAGLPPEKAIGFWKKGSGDEGVAAPSWIRYFAS
jgi:hypothetical protein